MRTRVWTALMLAALVVSGLSFSVIGKDGGDLPVCSTLGGVQNPTYEELNGAFSRLAEKDWQRITSPAYANESDWKSQQEFTQSWRRRFEQASWEKLLPTLQPGAVGQHRVLLCQLNEDALHRAKSDTSKEQARVTNRLIAVEPLYALYVNGTLTCTSSGGGSDEQRALHDSLCPNAR